jgi:hypothetical protein
MGLKAKALAVAVVVGVLVGGSFVIRTRLANRCPKASDAYEYKDFPNTNSSDSEILRFVKGLPSYGETEDWTKHQNCSGNGALVGRILATAVNERQEVLLASIYGAVIDSEKGRSKSEMASDLLMLGSADLTKRVFNADLLTKRAAQVESGEIKFARGIFEVLSESLDPDIREAFDREATIDRLAKSNGK